MNDLVIFLIFKFLPESPRYLMAAEKTDEALQILDKIAKENGGSLPNGKLVALDHPQVCTQDVNSH